MRTDKLNPRSAEANAQIVADIRAHGWDHRYALSVAPSALKCCKQCAFRAGSEERTGDPWNWVRLSEHWGDGETFLCHEGIPGHRCEVPGTPLRVCTGRTAIGDKETVHLCFPLHTEEEKHAG